MTTFKASSLRLVISTLVLLPLGQAASAQTHVTSPPTTDVVQVPAPLALTLTPATARVGNLTPGATIVWCSLAIEPRRQTIQIVHRNIITLAGPDGMATLARPIAPRSVWAAVDLKSGAYAIAAPAGFQPLALSETKKGFEHLGNGALSKLLAEVPAAELLWVRPGVGAWRATIGDGDANDDDEKSNGHIAIAPDRFEAVDSAMPAAPHQFSKGDVLIMIDANELAYLALRIGEKD